MIVAVLPALAVVFFAVKQLLVRKKKLTDRSRQTGHFAFATVLIVFGALTWAGGFLWLVAGGGFYGSPITEDAFRVDPRTGYSDYWSFWMIFIVGAGPVALFPCALSERYAPGSGAAAMIVLGAFVAEAGIRASRMYWGFAGENALIVIAFVSMPMWFLAAILLYLKDSEGHERRVIGGLIALFLLGPALTIRYKSVKRFWNANRPSQLDRRNAQRDGEQLSERLKKIRENAGSGTYTPAPSEQPKPP